MLLAESKLHCTRLPAATVLRVAQGRAAVGEHALSADGTAVAPPWAGDPPQFVLATVAGRACHCPACFAVVDSAWSSTSRASHWLAAQSEQSIGFWSECSRFESRPVTNVYGRGIRLRVVAWRTAISEYAVPTVKPGSSGWTWTTGQLMTACTGPHSGKPWREWPDRVELQASAPILLSIGFPLCHCLNRRAKNTKTARIATAPTESSANATLLFSPRRGRIAPDNATTAKMAIGATGPRGMLSEQRQSFWPGQYLFWPVHRYDHLVPGRCQT